MKKWLTRKKEADGTTEATEPDDQTDDLKPEAAP
jgi:hypothetical protein